MQILFSARPRKLRNPPVQSEPSSSHRAWMRRAVSMSIDLQIASMLRQARLARQNVELSALKNSGARSILVSKATCTTMHGMLRMHSWPT